MISCSVSGSINRCSLLVHFFHYKSPGHDLIPKYSQVIHLKIISVRFLTKCLVSATRYQTSRVTDIRLFYLDRQTAFLIINRESVNVYNWICEMFGRLQCHSGTAPWLASWHISGTLCRGLVRWRGALPVGAHRIIEVVPSCKLLLHLFSGTEKVFTRGVPYATQMPIVLQLNTPHRFWQLSLLSCMTKLRELCRWGRYFPSEYCYIWLETSLHVSFVL